MARKSGPTISQEDLYPLADEPGAAKKRACSTWTWNRNLRSCACRSASPSAAVHFPKKTVTRLTWGAVALAIVFVCGIAVAALYHYGERSWRFRVESSDDIDISGLQNVTHSQVMEVMGGDIGRNIFFVPLAQRKAQLEQIPWVESASVMRFIPNRLKVEIHERTPVAFARVGSRILLTDAGGTLMELPARTKYSFPVIVGMNNGEPPSTRLARMKIYNDVVSQLDAGGAHYSQELSEIDLSDPDDVKVTANNRAGEVLVHLGSSHYLERYKIYVTHVQEWQQQFDKLESVDLRYDRQIIVNPDLQGPMKQPPLSAEAARRAMAAGVKPAALITRISSSKRPSPALAVKPVATSVAKPAPVPSKPAASVRAAKTVHRKARARPARAWSKAKAKSRHNTAARISGAKTKPAPKSVAAVKASAKPSPAIAKGEPQ